MPQDSGNGQSVVPSTEVSAPNLKGRLDELDAGRNRCLKHASSLSRWSMLWKLIAIILGALVAAQGSMTKVWGNANWVTVTFIVLGVLVAVGSGFDAVFKPGERSPKFAAIAFEYEDLRNRIALDARSINREADSNTDEGQRALENRVDQLVRQSGAELKIIREKELALYITGPIGFSSAQQGRLRKILEAFHR